MAAAAPQPSPTARGALRLLEDCAALEQLEGARPHAFTRLEEAVGGRLARLLVHALVGDYGPSSRELVG
jgi:hypothetical protein